MSERVHIPAPEKRWSWGNVISVIPLLFVVSIWLYDRAKSAETIPALQATQQDLRSRVSVLESTVARESEIAESRYGEIIRRLERIDAKLSESGQRQP